MKTEEEVRQSYLQEPWGKLLNHMGYDPYNTESCGRRVAEDAAKIIDELLSQLRKLDSAGVWPDLSSGLESTLKKYKDLP